MAVEQTNTRESAPAGFTEWGSECLECGNATPGSNVCDCCGSSEHTTPLYISENATYAA